MNLFLGFDDLQKEVMVGHSSIIVMRPVLWEHVMSITSPDLHGLEGLSSQFPADNGVFFVGIVDFFGRQGASLYRWCPGTIGERGKRSPKKPYYERVGTKDVNSRVCLHRFGINSGRNFHNRSRGILVACTGLPIVYVYRLICSVFNGPPLHWDLTVDHLGPVDWNHPKLLRFCTLAYNK